MTAQRLPFWPRFMLKRMAADYCSLSLEAFEREIIAGRLPAPAKLGGKDHWCRNALDAALDRITGAGDEADWRRELETRYA